jgi:hypothetical protein
MIFIDRFKKYISAFILAVQISILGISALHTHVHHALAANELSFSSLYDSNQVTDPFLDENGKCKIFEFVQSVSNFLISNPNYYITPLNTKIVLKQSGQDFFFSTPKITNGLRAPPVL